MEQNTDILKDWDELAGKKPARYSRIAFVCMLGSVLLFFLEVSNSILIIRARGGSRQITAWGMLVLVLTVLAGTTCSIISMAKKEKNNAIKIIAAIINISLFLVLAAAFTSAIMDKTIR